MAKEEIGIVITRPFKGSNIILLEKGLEATLKIEIWFKTEEGPKRQPQEYVGIF